VHLVGNFIRKFVTMHGHMNVKNCASLLSSAYIDYVRKADKLTTVCCVYTYIAAGFVRVLCYMTSRKYRGALCRNKVIMRPSPSVETHMF
jgi:hypothetical protein